MNAINAADPAASALLEFLQGRAGAAPGKRVVLTPDVVNVPGMRSSGSPRVALRMEGRDSWSVEIEHGRVNPVLVHPLAHAGADAEELLIAGDAGLEVADGDADVVDLLVGQPSAFSSWSRCCSRWATRGRRTRYSALTSPCSTLTVRVAVPCCPVWSVAT